MSAAWVAGAIRAHGIARRRVGRAGARSLAACGDLEAALTGLANGPYGRYVHAGQTVAQAQRGVAATLLWHGRVLAGWVPPGGAQELRALAGWFEIANIDGLLDTFSGVAAAPPFRLGSLATAWPRLDGSRTRAELRQRLAATPWGDPGGEDDRSISMALRLRWAGRVRAGAPGARRWASGAVALLLAREVAAGRGVDAAPSLLMRAVGADVQSAATIDDLAARLPADARSALGSARTLDELVAAEAAWWARLESDAEAVSRTASLDAPQVVATVALLAVDAWRVRAALALAARGGSPLEAYDALV
jgi:hypothetical protein